MVCRHEKGKTLLKGHNSCQLESLMVLHDLPPKKMSNLAYIVIGLIKQENKYMLAILGIVVGFLILLGGSRYGIWKLFMLAGSHFTFLHTLVLSSPRIIPLMKISRI